MSYMKYLEPLLQCGVRVLSNKGAAVRQVQVVPVAVEDNDLFTFHSVCSNSPSLRWKKPTLLNPRGREEEIL